MKYEIKQLMKQTGVAFGTSGARGLATEMTDLVCYAYTRGFLQYLEEVGELTKAGTEVAIAGDLRPSTGRIMAAVAKAAAEMGYAPLNCGRIPSPAVALYGINNSCPAIMVTGSHIPADRNGIKFNKASGEVLKTDETGITSQIVELNDALFNEDGSFITDAILPAEDERAVKTYVDRYLNTFPSDCLVGKQIGIYQHSAVGREQLVEIFKGLGAEVTPLGFSDTFIPVDTEAIRDEDVELARQWAAEYGFDAILSTDCIYEVAGDGQEEFGEQRLLAAAQQHKDLLLRDLFPALLNEARQFAKDGAFDDDVCLVGFRLRELLNP